jgi:hypothetical protein
MKKNLKCVFLVTTILSSFPSFGSNIEIDFKDGTVGYSLSDHLDLMSFGEFPNNKDDYIGFFDTESVPPIHSIREAENYKIYLPDSHNYTLREEDGGPRYQLDNDLVP